MTSQVHALLLGVLVAAASSAPAQTRLVGTDPRDARTFVAACRLAVEAYDASYVNFTSEDLLRSEQCSLYVSGMLEGMLSVHGEVVVGTHHLNVCIPKTATPEAILRRIVSMATEHPDNLKIKSGGNYLLTMTAMVSLYPCGSSKDS